MRSIASRLLVGNAVVLSGFVILTALAVSWSVRERAETARFERLQGLVYGILGATEITPTAELVVGEGALPEQTLAQPVAGLYAELVGHDGTRLWQSRSSVRRVPPTVITPIGEWVFERLAANATLPAIDRLQLQSVWVLDNGEELPFIVHVVDERGVLGRELARFDRSLWSTLAGAALLLLGVQTLVLRRGLAPLGRIGREVREIERGERDTLGTEVPRELVPLADALDALLASERGRRRRYRDLLDDLAHNLKTPLSILGNLVPLDRPGAPGPSNTPNTSDTPDRADTLASAVREQTERMRASIERSLERARRPSAPVLAAPLPVRPVLERLTRSLAKLYDAERPVRYELVVPSTFTARFDDADLHEILGNVLENAAKYGASHVRVSDEDGGTTLLIDDDGPGFRGALDRERLLERGVRADSRAPGQGLGLAASRELMESHGGELALDESPLGGARVILRFAPSRSL